VKYSLTRFDVTFSVSLGVSSVAELSVGTVLTGGASGDGADCPNVRGIAAAHRTGMLRTRSQRNTMSP
jgi:hypothetical protein